MQKDRDAAWADLVEEHRKVREDFGQIHVAFDALLAAGPDADLHELLKALEDAAKDVRDGGIIGSGANAHRRALKRWRELQ